jgi:hypothetical protein
MFEIKAEAIASNVVTGGEVLLYRKVQIKKREIFFS